MPAPAPARADAPDVDSPWLSHDFVPNYGPWKPWYGFGTHRMPGAIINHPTWNAVEKEEGLRYWHLLLAQTGVVREGEYARLAMENDSLPFFMRENPVLLLHAKREYFARQRARALLRRAASEVEQGVYDEHAGQLMTVAALAKEVALRTSVVLRASVAAVEVEMAEERYKMVLDLLAHWRPPTGNRDSDLFGHPPARFVWKVCFVKILAYRMERAVADRVATARANDFATLTFPGVAAKLEGAPAAVELLVEYLTMLVVPKPVLVPVSKLWDFRDLDRSARRVLEEAVDQEAAVEADKMTIFAAAFKWEQDVLRCLQTACSVPAQLKAFMELKAMAERHRASPIEDWFDGDPGSTLVVCALGKGDTRCDVCKCPYCTVDRESHQIPFGEHAFRKLEFTQSNSNLSKKNSLY